MTPEGKVKEKVKKLLDPRRPQLYYDMPVPSGYGKSTLDFIGCYYGRFFAVETKRSGKELTSRQEGTRDDMRAAGGVVFEIIGDSGLDALAAWLNTVAEEASWST